MNVRADVVWVECRHKSRCSVKWFEQSARVRALPSAVPCIVRLCPPANYFPAQLAANCALALQHKCAPANWTLTKCAVMQYLSNGATAHIRWSRFLWRTSWHKCPISVTKICLHYNISNLPEKLSKIALNTFANFAVKRYPALLFNIELKKTAQSFWSASYIVKATMKKVSASVQWNTKCCTVAPWNLEAQKERKFVSSQSVKRR